jgi:hypothetical protein
MPINILNQPNTHIFEFSVEGKLTAEDVQGIIPPFEEAIKLAKNKLRLLVQVTDMDNADLKSEWETLSFLKQHVTDIELIAIVGAHAWEKIMSEVLASSIFVQAETRYFKADELDGATQWLLTAEHPSHIPERRVIDSPDGLFTKYSSPNFM